MAAVQPATARPARGSRRAGPAEPAALIIDGRGMIRDCNRSGEALFGYRRSELAWRHVSMLLPKLAEFDLMPKGEPNPRLRYLCRIGQRFQVLPRDKNPFTGDLFLNRLNGPDRLSLIVRPADDGRD